MYAILWLKLEVILKGLRKWLMKSIDPLGHDAWWFTIAPFHFGSQIDYVILLKN